MPNEIVKKQLKAESAWAAKIISDLINAAHDCAIVPLHGENVDSVFSQKEPSKLMGLQEAERRLDKAIKAAWLALTQKPLREKDPVSFVMQEGEYGK